MTNAFHARPPRFKFLALVIFLVALLPYGVLLMDGLSNQALDRPFWSALGRSLKQGGVTLIIAVSFGWPLGTLLGLARIPGWRLFLCLLAVPILVPTFLWAIGISSLQAFFAYKWRAWFDGFSGAVWASAVQTLPVVMLAAALGTMAIPAGVGDATRLAAGNRGLFRLACQWSFPVAVGAGLFAMMHGLADPGVSQIMGYHGVATEVLVALGANYDFATACTKAFILTGLMTLVAVPILWSVSNKWAATLMGKTSAAFSRIHLDKAGMFVGAGLLLISILVSVAPLAGLLRPLRGANLEEPLRYFFSALKQAGTTTLTISLISAVTATLLGAGVGRLVRGRFAATRGLLFGGLLLFALPVSLHALGWAKVFSGLPPAFDWFTRDSNLGLGICLGLKFFPVPMLLVLHANARRHVSQDATALLLGIPGGRYLLKVWLPQMSPTLLASMILVGLLASTDVAGTLTLQPAGEATLTTRFFAVLDNASEKSLAVWSLGLTSFVGLTAIVTWAIWAVLKRFAGNCRA